MWTALDPIKHGLSEPSQHGNLHRVEPVGTFCMTGIDARMESVHGHGRKQVSLENMECLGIIPKHGHLRCDTPNKIRIWRFGVEMGWYMIGLIHVNRFFASKHKQAAKYFSMIHPDNRTPWDNWAPNTFGICYSAPWVYQSWIWPYL